MTCVNVGLFHRIELQDPETELLCFSYAVGNELFTDMLPAAGRRDRIARIAYMTASSDIVRVQDIQADNKAAVISCNSVIAL